MKVEMPLKTKKTLQNPLYGCHDPFTNVNKSDYSPHYKHDIRLRPEMTKPFLRPWPAVPAKKRE